MNYKIQIQEDYTAKPEYKFNFDLLNSIDYKKRKCSPYDMKNYTVVKKENMSTIGFDRLKLTKNFIPEETFLIDYCESRKNDDHTFVDVYKHILKRLMLNSTIMNIYLDDKICNYIIKNDINLFRKILKNTQDKPLFTYNTGLQCVNDPMVMLLYLEAYHTNQLNDILNQFHYLFMHNIDLFVRCIYTNDILVKHLPINKVIKGKTLYQIAALENNYDAVKYILKHYVNLDVFHQDENGKDAYHLTTSNRIKKKMEQILNPDNVEFYTNMIRDEYLTNPLTKD